MRELAVFGLFCLSAVLIVTGVVLVSVPAAFVAGGIAVGGLTVLGAQIGNSKQ